MSTISPTLATNERARALVAAGVSITHLGFGEAGLPVHPKLAEVLSAAARDGNQYGPTGGSPASREAVAGYFQRRGIAAVPDRVILGPGSKALLWAVVHAAGGDVVLPKPSWVSYAAQATLSSRRVIWVPTTQTGGAVPDPVALDAAVTAARSYGAQPRCLVLTVPDNPTGTIAQAADVKAVCDVAAKHELLIISDEIYRDLCYDSTAMVSAATYAPERTVVTSGLSKATALGGWRVGVGLMPNSPLGEEIRASVLSTASEVWSCLPGPMERVAQYAFDDPPEITDFVNQARGLHQSVCEAVHRRFVDAGARCRAPMGAFYLYPELEFARRPGIETGAELADWLLDRHRVVVLAGIAFGDEPGALRARVATSMLYGATPAQRWQALESDNPAELPWIAAALHQVEHALAAL